jgi:RNA polymerase sigma-70 factor (ECF subfamily)
VSHADAGPRARIDALYRSESRLVLATLIRLLDDFDLAEEALQDAFTAAMEQWPRDGTPANPRAWLISTGRFKAIDRLRRRARFDAILGELAARLDDQPAPDPRRAGRPALGGRPAAVDLHLLPSGPTARRPGGDDAA